MSYATKNQLKAFAQAIKEKFAKKHDPDAIAGSADQLITTVGVTDKVPYNFRASGGSADIGNRLNDKIVGGTIVWNQLIPDEMISKTQPSGTSVQFYQLPAPTVAGHKYLLTAYRMDDSATSLHLAINNDQEYSIGGSNISFLTGSAGEKSVVWTRDTSKTHLYVYKPEAVEATWKNLQLYDLTAMFGSAVADAVYALDQATTGAGVAWLRALFPKPYYAYNAGELMNVKTSAHKTVGFNAWDEEWESGNINIGETSAVQYGEPFSDNYSIRSKNFVRAIPNASYCLHSPQVMKNSSSDNALKIVYYDADKRYISYVRNYGNWNDNAVVTTPSNCAYIKIALTGNSTHPIITYDHDTCINLSHSGYRNGEYEPYREHVYPLSNIELRGIPRIADGKLYFDGDTYAHDGTVTRKYGIVDLGTLGWYRQYPDQDNETMIATVSDIKLINYWELHNMVCPKYQTALMDDVQGHVIPNSICLSHQGTTIKIYDPDFIGKTASQFKTAMSGIYLVYELATPTTESADPFADPQIVDDFGTEEYVDTRDIPIPVGHETLYQANLRDKLQRLPEMPQAPGDYIIRYDGVKCVFVPLSQQND